MDLEWLLPEQIDQILKFCELSAVQDLTVAANILETHQWDIEKAMHDVVSQNDQQEKRQIQKITQQSDLVPETHKPQQMIYNDHFQNEGEFEMGEEDYHQLLDHTNKQFKPASENHSSILAQQNFEYEEVQRKMIEEQKLKEQNEKLKEQNELLMKQREEEIKEGQKEFQDRVVNDPIMIKFRLAYKTVQCEFSQKDKVETVFKYTNCCLRDGFENRYSEFDLTQAFPQLSLKERKDQILEDVFEGSTGEVLIVKEIQ